MPISRFVILSIMIVILSRQAKNPDLHGILRFAQDDKQAQDDARDKNAFFPTAFMSGIERYATLR